MPKRSLKRRRSKRVRNSRRYLKKGGGIQKLVAGKKDLIHVGTNFIQMEDAENIVFVIIILNMKNKFWKRWENNLIRNFTIHLHIYLVKIRCQAPILVNACECNVKDKVFE
jgi:hypothetical protein